MITHKIILPDGTIIEFFNDEAILTDQCYVKSFRDIL